jgi:hypothetical protein
MWTTHSSPSVQISSTKIRLKEKLMVVNKIPLLDGALNFITMITGAKH